jgi:flagella basal body P-ring formation protein FlgA
MQTLSKLPPPRPAMPKPHLPLPALASAMRPRPANRLTGRHVGPMLLGALLLGLPFSAMVGAQTPAGPMLPETVLADVQRVSREAALVVWGSAQPQPRIEVLPGRLDPRLQLAPCQQIVAYLPAGQRPLGRTRVGLRCAQGATAWNVSLPVDVRVWGPSLVAATALPAGTVLEPRHLAQAEVDLAARADPPIGEAAQAVGRTLARGLAPGDALRSADLKFRVWFNTGDTVRIVSVGPGYAVSSEGQAMGPGLDGQGARVRTEGGRIVSGIATGARRVEVAL